MEIRSIARGDKIHLTERQIPGGEIVAIARESCPLGRPLSASQSPVDALARDLQLLGNLGCSATGSLKLLDLFDRH